MNNNEIMTNEVVEETVEVVEESKKINPATGIVAGLAIIGTYCLVTKTVEFTKDTISKIKAKRASFQDVVDDDLVDVDEDYFAE